jgi:hypothetical protein
MDVNIELTAPEICPLTIHSVLGNRAQTEGNIQPTQVRDDVN